MIHCFHHNDLDGRCAGFLVLNAFGDVYCHEMTYDKPFPLADIKQGDDVWIVDFSIAPEVMKQLLDVTPNVIWCDHHVSAVRKYNNFPVDIKGLRDESEPGVAGCVLTERYLGQISKIPFVREYVSLVGDYDTHELKYGDKTWDFHYGLLSYPNLIDADVWYNLENGFVYDDVTFMENILRRGRVCRDFFENFCKDYFEQNGFEFTYDGLKGIAVNITNTGDTIFNVSLSKNVLNNYDLKCTFVLLGGKWHVSLYSSKVDVSKIAESFGGGGHAGAAGFVTDSLNGFLSL